MTQQLRQLRNEVTADTSQYVRALGEAERAAEGLGRSAAELGRKVEETDKKATKSAAGFAQLRRSIDPMAAANDRLTRGLKTLSDAMAVGKIDDLEHARLKALLVERYDLAGQAATRAAKAQADASKAAQVAAAEEAAGLARLRGRYDEGYAAAEKYNTALAELAKLQRAGALSGASLAEAQAKVERELNPANAALAKQNAELQKLRDSLDPASAAAKRLEQQERTLREAFERGTISGLEYDQMLRKLRAGHDDAADGARKTGSALRDVLGEGAREAASHVGFAGEAVLALGRAGAGAVAGIAAAGVAVAALVAASIPAAGEFQKLQATLRTVGGSAQLASAEFEMIKEFALQTPMSVEQVTQAFIKLKAMGLDPSMAALRSYGNTAGAMGKSVQDMVEAVADATTGEFERLKEFGIKSAQEGNKVTFTFQGIKTTVANNATEIQKYLLAIGNTKFSTGMAEQSATLSGAIDELSDNWQIFLANLGNSGPVQAATALIRALADAVSGLNSMLFPSIKEQITATRGEVETLRREIAEMEKFPDAYGPELAGRRAVLIEREKSLAALVKEQAEREKLIQTSRVQTKAETEVDEALKKEIKRRQEVTDRLDIEWDERNRLLQATREGREAVIALNRELEGERAIREFLGTTNNKAAHQMMASNKDLAEQARRVQEVARANYDLKIATDEVTEAQKAAEEARKKAAEEAKRAAEKYYEDIARESEKISEDVAGTIYDSLTDPDKASGILDWFKSLFKRIAVAALANSIVLPITTQIVGSMPGMFGIQGSGGALGTAGGMAGGAGNLLTTAGGQALQYSGFMAPGGMVSSALGTTLIGGTTTGAITQSGSLAAAYSAPSTIAGSAGGLTVGGALGAAGVGFAAGGLVGGWLGNKTGSRVVGGAGGAVSGAAAGAALGSVVPGIGTLAGAIIGGISGLLGGVLGTSSKPSNKEGNATVDLASGGMVIGGQTGDKFSQENRDAAAAAAQTYGQIAKLLGNFAGRQVSGNLKVAMGDRDGMVATINGQSQSFKRDDAGIARMSKWITDTLAAQVGATLPADIRQALQKIDWKDLEKAIADINFAGNFQDSLKALRGDFGLMDQQAASAREEVRTLTAQINEFRGSAARLGLDTNAANSATRSYVEGLLGMRAVAAPMNETEAAVALLRVRFEAMAPLLEAVGIHAGEAALGLQRAITALRDDFIAGLDREFHELSGREWINQIDDTFAALEDRLRSAAALGGGGEQALRNNHAAIVNILEELEDPQLDEAAARYGGNIAIIAEAIKASRVVLEEAAPAVVDSARWWKELTQQFNDLAGNGYINQVTNQFEAMNAQLSMAAQVGFGSGEVLAANHLAMVKILEALSDDQLAAAAERFGGGIKAIAESLMAARLATERAGFMRDVGREGLELSGVGYVNSINDQFAKLTDQMAVAARVGTGTAEVLTNNHLAMVKILEALSDDQLRDSAARFGDGIAAIAESLIAGRIATEAATAAQQAATAAQEKALDAANERVERARDAVQRAYGKEIDAQKALSDAAKTAGDNMRRFAGSFRDLRQSLLTGDLSPLSPESRYNEARAQFQAAAGKAAAGDEGAMAELSSVAQTFLRQSRAYFASSATYAQDFGLVQEALSKAEASAGAQASAADAQLAQATAQTSLLQSQLDAINGTTAAVMSIPASIAELTSALVAQAAAGGGGAGSSSGTVGGIDVVSAAYQQYLGRAPDAGGYADWQARLTAGGSIASVVGGIAGSDEAYIRGLYTTLLGREPDAGGAQQWGSVLRSGVSRAEVERLIKASDEGRARGYEAGGPIGFVDGGMVINGRWNQDSVTAMLAGGEYVTRAPSVNSGTLATLSHINRHGSVPANDTGGDIRALRDETRRQTAALQEGFLQLIKLTGKQTADISDLRAAQRRKAAS